MPVFYPLATMERTSQDGSNAPDCLLMGVDGGGRTTPPPPYLAFVTVRL
jgi:hypothetical protein